MLKNTHAVQGEEYEKYEIRKKEAEEKRAEQEEKNAERLRSQAIRGQVADEFTRIRFSLPYFAEQAAESESQVVMSVLRLALRKPQARYRLGQLINHIRKSKEDPLRPTSASTDSARSAESEARFMSELEQVVKEVSREPRKARKQTQNPSDKFPVPDVYSVKPLPEDLTGNATDAANLDKANSQAYVRALEHMVDTDLAKVIADNAGDPGGRDNNKSLSRKPSVIDIAKGGKASAMSGPKRKDSLAF